MEGVLRGSSVAHLTPQLWPEIYCGVCKLPSNLILGDIARELKFFRWSVLGNEYFCNPTTFSAIEI